MFLFLRSSGNRGPLQSEERRERVEKTAKKDGAKEEAEELTSTFFDFCR